MSQLSQYTVLSSKVQHITPRTGPHAPSSQREPRTQMKNKVHKERITEWLGYPPPPSHEARNIKPLCHSSDFPPRFNAAVTLPSTVHNNFLTLTMHKAMWFHILRSALPVSPARTDARRCWEDGFVPTPDWLTGHCVRAWIMDSCPLK